MRRRDVPARPPRDTRLDLVRGWLQLTIYMSHIGLSWIGGWLLHGAWGLSDSSELFVFLSGYTLGSVFARKGAAEGWLAATRDLAWRILRLYRFQLTVFVLFGLMILLAERAGLAGELDRLGWAPALTHPWAAIAGALTMLYQPEFMGILPVFVWSMLLLPFFAWGEARIGVWALLPSWALYAAAQWGGLAAPPLIAGTGIGFNPFAWQVLFLLGAFLGRRVLYFGQALPNFPRPGGGVLFGLAVLMLAAGLFLRLGWYGFLPFPAPVPEDAAWVGKESLALPRLLHALALAGIIGVLVPRDAAWMHRRWARWLAPIGQHSLEVFCVGLFLSWMARQVLAWQPAWWWLDPLVVAGGFALLAAYAAWLVQRKRRGRPAPAGMQARST